MRSANGLEVDTESEEYPRIGLLVDERLHVYDATVRLSLPRGIDPREWLRRPAADLFVPDERERVETALRDAIGGQWRSFATTLELAGGRSDYVVRISPGVRFVHLDAQPRPKEPPIRPTSADHRLEYLGLVVSRVAHDFKNLLAAVLVNAEFLRREAEDPVSVREVADEVLMATERARELIDQILGYAGAIDATRISIDLNEMTREMGRLLDVSTPPTVVMRYDLELGLPKIWGQPTQLRQLLMNFIVNAAEAIGDDVGSISIRTRTVDADMGLLEQTRTSIMPPPGRYVCIEIEDTGPGLDTQTAQRVFEPFFSTKADGHGLGLSGSRGVVEEHGGALLLESSPGQGALFRVLLPPAESGPLEVARPVAAPSHRSFRGHAVLVVDDDDLVRSSTLRTLSARGFEVFTASNGLEGIEIFTAQHARLSCVLLDLGMPYFKGSDVYDELRAIDPRVPVIFVSGHSQEELMSYESVRAADGVLLKPYRDDELLELLINVLEPHGDDSA